jgi:O-antigen ligase
MQRIVSPSGSHDRLSLIAERRAVIAETVVLNVMIIGVMLLGHRLPGVAGVAVGVLVIGLCVKACVQPVPTFFTLIGIKLTYDTLWFLDLPLLSDVARPLAIFLAPVLIVCLVGPRLPLGRPTQVTFCAVLYIGWVVCAQVLNEEPLSLEVTTRQAGMLIGLVLGAKYVRSHNALEFLCLLVSISAVLPVLLGLLQFAFPEAAIFHAKMDALRGNRASGIYYDSGTASTVYLMACLCSAYLLLASRMTGRAKKYVGILLVCGVALIVAGGTLSMLAAMCCALLILGYMGVVRFRNPLVVCVLLPLAMVMLYVVRQASLLNPIQNKVTVEFERLEEGVRAGDPFANRQMFSGRMGLWQKAWAEFQEAGTLQKLFGLGISGSHSTYVHLLVQIGVVGLLLYLSFHGWIVSELMRLPGNDVARTLAILAVLWILLIGVSLTMVWFTSLQWFVYILVGAVLNDSRVPVTCPRWRPVPSPSGRGWM